MFSKLPVLVLSASSVYHMHTAYSRIDCAIQVQFYKDYRYDGIALDLGFLPDGKHMDWSECPSPGKLHNAKIHATKV
jgi:hypothetical protein